MWNDVETTQDLLNFKVVADTKSMTIHDKILQRLNSIGIPELAGLRKLNELSGSYINLECRLPNGKTGKILDDDKTYFGAQCERPGSDRCYGVAADETQIAIYEYGCNGTDAELILWTKL